MNKKFKLRVPPVHDGFSNRIEGLKNQTGEFTFDGLDKLKVNSEKISKASKRVNANRIVAEFYKRYYSDLGKVSKRPDSIENCFTHAWVDYYRLSAVKDIKSVNLCHDKFCLNCQNQISQHRYSKYKPVLDELSKDYNIYHVVLTIPNCSDVVLKHTLDKMYKKFGYLIRFFQGSKKIKGIDFSEYGFVAGIRALEVGVKEKGFLSEMHPHFHCLFLFSKNFQDVGSHFNTYSLSKSEIKDDFRLKNNGKVFFSDFEILLQKLWYLVYNNEKVTKKKIDDLELGYSCYAKKVKKQKYHEVFKYCFKGMFDPKTTQFLFSESTFRYLLDSIHRRKIIQGYGFLNKFSFLDEEEKQEIDAFYAQRVIALRQIENPLELHATVPDLVKEMESGSHIRYISKNSLRAKVDIFADGEDEE